MSQSKTVAPGHRTEATPPGERVRLPYRRPEVKSLGSVRDLTLGFGGSRSDAAAACRTNNSDIAC